MNLHSSPDNHCELASSALCSASPVSRTAAQEFPWSCEANSSTSASPLTVPQGVVSPGSERSSALASKPNWLDADVILVTPPRVRRSSRRFRESPNGAEESGVAEATPWTRHSAEGLTPTRKERTVSPGAAQRNVSPRTSVRFEHTASPPVTPPRRERHLSPPLFGSAGQSSHFSQHLATPRTPRRVSRSSSPPKAPRVLLKDDDALLAALLSNSVGAVQGVLEQDPEAALNPIMEGALLGPPLCVAVTLGCSPSVVAVLLKHRADANASDSEGRPPLSILCSVPSWRSEMLEGALAAAAVEREQQSCQVAEQLLRAGADITVQDDAGWCAERFALATNNRHLLDLLADADSLGNACDMKEEQSPSGFSLSASCQRTSLSRSQRCVSPDGSCNAPLKRKHALHPGVLALPATRPRLPRPGQFVTGASPVQELRLLSKRSGSPSSPRGQKRSTSLFQTPQFDEPSLCMQSIARTPEQAKPSLNTPAPRTPTRVEQILSPPPAPRRLLQGTGSSLLVALRSNSVEAVQKALDEDPQAARSPILDEGFVGPPLCVALSLGCGSAIVALLLSRGADVNVTDSRGRSPLSILCSRPSWRSDIAEGCLDEEAAGMEESSSLVARQLLRAGANAASQDSAGMCAVSLALASGNRHLADVVALARRL